MVSLPVMCAFSLSRPRSTECGCISFDHLIGAGEQRRRDDEAKCIGSLKVDDQLELGRLLDGLNAGEDFARRSGSRQRQTFTGCVQPFRNAFWANLRTPGLSKWELFRHDVEVYQICDFDPVAGYCPPEAYILASFYVPLCATGTG